MVTDLHANLPGSRRYRVAGEKECWPPLITACLKQEGQVEERELDLKHLDLKITDLGKLQLNSQTGTMKASSC